MESCESFASESFDKVLSGFSLEVWYCDSDEKGFCVSEEVRSVPQAESSKVEKSNIVEKSRQAQWLVNLENLGFGLWKVFIMKLL